MRPFPWTALLLLPLSACSGGSPQADPAPTSAVVSSPTAIPTLEPSPSQLPTVIATVTASATASPTKGAVETAPAPGAPTCKAATLTVTDADVLVTQQSREEVFVVRTSGPDCGLAGFPTPTLRGSDGKALAVTYARDGSKPASLSLSKGTSVSFSLTSARAGTCVDASSLSVVLPGTGSALSTSSTARVCNGAVTVSPIRRLYADS